MAVYQQRGSDDFVRIVEKCTNRFTLHYRVKVFHDLSQSLWLTCLNEGGAADLARIFSAPTPKRTISKRDAVLSLRPILSHSRLCAKMVELNFMKFYNEFAHKSASIAKWFTVVPTKTAPAEIEEALKSLSADDFCMAFLILHLHRGAILKSFFESFVSDPPLPDKKQLFTALRNIQILDQQPHPTMSPFLAALCAQGTKADWKDLVKKRIAGIELVKRPAWVESLFETCQVPLETGATQYMAALLACLHLSPQHRANLLSLEEHPERIEHLLGGFCRSDVAKFLSDPAFGEREFSVSLTDLCLSEAVLSPIAPAPTVGQDGTDVGIQQTFKLSSSESVIDRFAAFTKDLADDGDSTFDDFSLSQEGLQVLEHLMDRAGQSSTAGYLDMEEGELDFLTGCAEHCGVRSKLPWRFQFLNDEACKLHFRSKGALDNACTVNACFVSVVRRFRREPCIRFWVNLDNGSIVLFPEEGSKKAHHLHPELDAIGSILLANQDSSFCLTGRRVTYDFSGEETLEASEDTKKASDSAGNEGSDPQPRTPHGIRDNEGGEDTSSKAEGGDREHLCEDLKVVGGGLVGDFSTTTAAAAGAQGGAHPEAAVATSGGAAVEFIGGGLVGDFSTTTAAAAGAQGGAHPEAAVATSGARDSSVSSSLSAPVMGAATKPEKYDLETLLQMSMHGQLEDSSFLGTVSEAVVRSADQALQYCCKESILSNLEEKCICGGCAVVTGTEGAAAQAFGTLGLVESTFAMDEEVIFLDPIQQLIGHTAAHVVKMVPEEGVYMQSIRLLSERLPSMPSLFADRLAGQGTMGGQPTSHFLCTPAVVNHFGGDYALLDCEKAKNVCGCVELCDSTNRIMFLSRIARVVNGSILVNMLGKGAPDTRNCFRAGLSACPVTLASKQSTRDTINQQCFVIKVGYRTMMTIGSIQVEKNHSAGGWKFVSDLEYYTGKEAPVLPITSVSFEEWMKTGRTPLSPGDRFRLFMQSQNAADALKEVGGMTNPEQKQEVFQSHRTHFALPGDSGAAVVLLSRDILLCSGCGKADCSARNAYRSLLPAAVYAEEANFTQLEKVKGTKRKTERLHKRAQEAASQACNFFPVIGFISRCDEKQKVAYAVPCNEELLLASGRRTARHKDRTP